MDRAIGQPGNKPWRRIVFWLAVALILGTAAVISLRCWRNHLPFFGMYHDDAIYLVTAKSLAEGSGYRIPSLPGEPAQTKYPLFYPLLLSIIWRFNGHFPENLPAIEALGLVFGYSFAILAVLYLYRTRRITAGIAVVILGATLFNIKLQSLLPIPMSDLLYGALSVGALWSSELIALRAGKRLGIGWLLMSAVSALAALTRAVGAPLGMLVTLNLIMGRKYLVACLTLLVLALTLFPFWSWERAEQSLQPGWMIYYTNYTKWMADAYRDVGAGVVVAHKATDMLTSVPLAIWPLVGLIPYARLTPLQFFLVYRLGIAVLWLVMLLGIGRDLLNRRRWLLAAYVSIYWLSMLAWPGYLEWRLVLVILPFVYYFYYRGWRLLSAGLKRQLGGGQLRLYQLLCAMIACLFAAYLIAGSAYSSILRAGYYPKRLPLRTDITAQEEHADMLATYEWIKASTPERETWVCNNDPLLYLYTGRRAVQPSAYQGWRIHSLQLVTPGTVTDALRYSGASYLLLDPCYGAAYKAYGQYVMAVAALNLEYPGLLTPVYLSPHGALSAFKVDRVLLAKIPGSGQWQSDGR